MTKAARRAMASFQARYERDRGTLTPENWGAWVNALPLPEFMAMVSLREPPEPPEPKPAKTQKPVKPKNVELCKRLAGVAAFNLDEWPKAQATVYRAIRELQR